MGDSRWRCRMTDVRPSSVLARAGRALVGDGLDLLAGPDDLERRGALDLLLGKDLTDEGLVLREVQPDPEQFDRRRLLREGLRGEFVLRLQRLAVGALRVVDLAGGVRSEP